MLWRVMVEHINVSSVSVSPHLYGGGGSLIAEEGLTFNDTSSVVGMC